MSDLIIGISCFVLLIFLVFTIIFGFLLKQNGIIKVISKNRGIAFTVLVLIPICIFLYCQTMHFLVGWSSGSTEGWLGFLGAYFGAIIAIGGIYWQVNKELSNDRNKTLISKRPVVNIQRGYQLVKGDKVFFKEVKDVDHEKYAPLKRGKLDFKNIDGLRIMNCSNNPIIHCKVSFEYKAHKCSVTGSENGYIGKKETFKEYYLIPLVVPFESVFVVNIANLYRFYPYSLYDIESIKLTYLNSVNEVNETKFEFYDSNDGDILIPSGSEPKDISFQEYLIQLKNEGHKLATSEKIKD